MKNETERKSEKNGRIRKREKSPPISQHRVSSKAGIINCASSAAFKTPPKHHNHRLGLTHYPIDAFKRLPGDAKKFNHHQFKKVKASIREFGFVSPVIVDKELNVIVGWTRILAAKELGYPDLPAVRLDHLTEAELRAYRLADNQLAANPDFDIKLLSGELKLITELDVEFNVDLIGFSAPEIDLIHIKAETVPSSDISGDEDLASGPPVTKLGGLYKLGNHHIYCGSSLDAAALPFLLRGELANLVVADPPYNVSVKKHVSRRKNSGYREFAQASGEMNNEQFTTFLRTFMILARDHSRDGSLHYIFMDHHHADNLIIAASDIYAKRINICVWRKHNGGLGGMYRSQHELVFVYKHGASTHRNNIQLGRHGRNRTNVWDYPGANQGASTGEEGRALDIHPTSKPVRLIADIILDCTKRGDVVLDPFLGGGATLIAAERTGRKCYGIEIDPLYCDTAIRRWQAFTGEKAIDVESGLSFDELASKCEVSHD